MSTDTLKALSVRQPWAELIVRYGKDVENRTWRTDFRGPLVIHASKQPDPDYANLIADLGDVGMAVHELLSLDVREGGARGALVGVVDLVDVVDDADSPWATKGCLHWLLENPRPLPAPVAWKGTLGLWKLSRDHLERTLDVSERLLLPSAAEVAEEDALRMLLEVMDDE